MSYLILALLALGIAVAQAGVGGMKLLYSLPAYGIIGLAALCSLFQHSRRISIGVRAACLGSAVALAGCVVVRSQFSPVDYLARHDFFMTLAALTVYLLTATFLSECRHRIVFIVILLAFAAAHLWIGVLQFRYGQFSPFSPWIERTEHAYRASGFYFSPNHLAGLLETLGLMAVALACWANWRLIHRMIAGYAALICFIGVAITGSRGGYVSTLAGLLIFGTLSMIVVWRLRPPRFWLLLSSVLMLFAALVCGGVGLMGKSQMLRDRLAKIVEPDIGRLAMWDAATKQFALSPLTGTGSGTSLFHGRHFRTNPIDRDRDPAHVQNDWLELLCEYGILGAVAMALFLGVHGWSSFSGMQRIVAEVEAMGWGALNDELALLLGALSGLAALLVHSVFDCNLHVPGNTLVVAFVFSILAAPTVETLLPEESAAPSSAVHWLRFLAPMIGLYLLVVGVPRVEGEYAAECAGRALRDADFASVLMRCWMWEGIGRALHDADDVTALRFAERGLAVEKKNPNLFHYFGIAKYSLAKAGGRVPTERLHESREVIGAFHAGLELFPNDARLLLNLARALDDYGRFAEAGPVFEQAIAADPSYPFARASQRLHFQMQQDAGQR